MFSGSFTHNVDTKGRVFVPSKLRQELGQSFHVCRGLVEHCIRAYNNAEWEIVMEKLYANPDIPTKTLRLFSSTSGEVEMDAQGRILLPENLRAYARITDKANIVGMKDWIEIWNPAEYADYMGDGEEDTVITPEDYDLLRKAGLR